MSLNELMYFYEDQISAAEKSIQSIDETIAAMEPSLKAYVRTSEIITAQNSKDAKDINGVLNNLAMEIIKQVDEMRQKQNMWNARKNFYALVVSRLKNHQLKLI